MMIYQDEYEDQQSSTFHSTTRIRDSSVHSLSIMKIRVPSLLIVFLKYSQLDPNRLLVFHILPPHHEHTFHPDHLEFIDPVAPPLHSQTFSFLLQKPSSHCIPKHCTAIASVQNCTTMVCATKQLWAWLFIHML